jgi:hypothetical protein
MLRGWIAGTAVVGVLALAGCGGGSGGPTSTQETSSAPQVGRTPAGQRAAAAAVLTLADLPAGWRAGAAGGDRSPANTCPAIAAARAIAAGRRVSPTFSHGSQNVADTVYVFTAEPQARQAFVAIRSAASRACVARTLASQVAGEADDVTTIGAVRSGTVAVPRAGEETSDLRFTVPVTTKGTRVDVPLDVVLVRQGRGISFLALQSVAKPFGPAARDRLARAAARKLRQAVARH